MPAPSFPRNEQSKFKLSRSQEMILAALEEAQEGVSLRKLIHSIAQRPITPAEEIEYARRAKAHCDWLEAHNLLVSVEQKGHLIYSKQGPLRPVVAGKIYRPSYSTARQMVLVSAVALVLAACTHSPFSKESPSDKQVRPYNAATLPVITERIAQFADQSGDSVYRYCREGECPSPTPKVPARIQERTTQQLGTPPARARITDEKSLKDALKSFAKDAGKTDLSSESGAKPTAKVIRTESKAGLRETKEETDPRKGTKQTKAPAEKAATTEAPKPEQNPQPVAWDVKAKTQVSENEKAPVASTRISSDDKPLKVDTSFASYDGLVSFGNGAEVMSSAGKEQVEKLLDQARSASLIRLRGHAASRSLTEDQRKLAIGRSIAVKLEFMKHGVERQKIRILNPKDNDLLDASYVSADVNRSVEIMIQKGN